jgi:hypothetical protein
VPLILLFAATDALGARRLSRDHGLPGAVRRWQVRDTRDLDNLWIAALADPFGMRALNLTTRYWTAEERNTQLPALAGYILANRALWLTVAALLIGATLKLFRTERSGTSRWLRLPAFLRRKPRPAPAVVAASVQSRSPRQWPADSPASASTSSRRASTPRRWSSRRHS